MRTLFTGACALGLSGLMFLSGCLQVLGLEDYRESGAGGSGASGSTGATMTSSSTGESCVADAPCYSGAPGTEGKGNCKAGKQVCDGAGLASCDGEITPASEDFYAKGDEDCDGHARAEVLSASEHGGDSIGIQDMATDAAGNLIVVGFFSPSVNFGPDPSDALVAQLEQDFFVAKFDPTGKFLWSKRFGDSTNEVIIRMATTSTGDIWLTGVFKGQITFGATTLTAPSAAATFVALLDADGNPLRARKVGDAAPSYADIAALPGGDAVVSGNYQTAIDLGQGFSFSTTDQGGYVLRIARGSLDTVWAQPIGDATNFGLPDGRQEVRAIATDSTGNVVATGNFEGSIYTAGTGTAKADGQRDGFVLRLNSGGTQTHLLTAGGTGDVSIDAVATDSTGAFAVTGTFTEDLRLLDINFASNLDTTGATDRDFFVWKVSGAGKHIWSKQFGDSTDQTSPDPLPLWPGFSATADGGLLWGYRYRGSMTAGDQVLTSKGDDDAFLVVLKADGTVDWAKSFGDATPAQVTTAVAPLGPTSFAAAFFNSGAIDLGQGPLSPKAPDVLDAILASFEL